MSPASGDKGLEGEEHHRVDRLGKSRKVRYSEYRAWAEGKVNARDKTGQRYHVLTLRDKRGEPARARICGEIRQALTAHEIFTSSVPWNSEDSK